MKLHNGQTYDLVNLETKERGRFTIHDLLTHKSQYIVYGTLAAHEVRVFRGVQGSKERASCPVVLPGESGVTVAKFVDQLGGLPLAFRQGADLLFLVNMQSIPGFWAGSQSREDLLQKSRKVIDLFHEWKKLGEQMPLWFRQLRQEAKAGQGKNGGSGSGLLI